MRFFFKSIPILVAVILLVSSCTIEKRVFRKGYSISWRHKLKNQSGDGITESAAENEQIANASPGNENTELNPTIESIDSSATDSGKRNEVKMNSALEKDEISINRSELFNKTIKETVENKSALKQLKVARGSGNFFLVFIAVIVGVIVLCVVSAIHNLKSEYSDDNGIGIVTLLIVVPFLAALLVIGAIIFAIVGN